MSNTYFLIPMYNEEKTIGLVLRDLLDNNCTDIVVVNDGSNDNSVNVVKGFKNVVLINHLINRGPGAALATGLEYLSQQEDCHYVVTFDADGQHLLRDALRMVDFMKNNQTLDVVLGSRFISGAKSNVPFLRKVVLKSATVFLKMLYDIQVTDAHNGLKVINKSAIRKMIPKLNDFSHGSELLYLIQCNQLKFCEYPTDILYSSYSLMKGQRTLNAFKVAWTTLAHKINILILGG